MNRTIKVIQLCSYFTSSRVHKNLFAHLDKKLIQQVYVPVRNKGKIGSNHLHLQNGFLTYDKIWNWYHRVFYWNKIAKASINIQKLDKFLNFFFHAHTWFSDGGSAYLIYKKYHIPYIITIRNTDINLFYNKLIYLRKFGHKILLAASSVIFVSPAYRQKLIEKLPHRIKEDIARKSIIIPNGIDSFWFENLLSRKTINTADPISILFVGSILPLKNIERLIEAYLQFQKNIQNSSLTIIGFRNSGKYEKKIKDNYGRIENIRLLDQINDKEILLTHYRKADLFIMPSLTETFGLVYIEALSQGLPIIYSKGHGVDGYFDDIKNGIAVNPKSVDEITQAIQTIYENYSDYLNGDLSYLDQFRWENIAEKYMKVYQEISS